MTTANTSPFPYHVNGQEFKSLEQVIAARHILEQAAKEGAITGNPQDYDLKSLIIDDKVYGWEEEVDLSKDNEFITLPNSPTTVT